jgi:outer membrane protein assembly factor BamB
MKRRSGLVIAVIVILLVLASVYYAVAPELAGTQTSMTAATSATGSAAATSSSSATIASSTSSSSSSSTTVLSSAGQQSQTSTSQGADWLTYHADNARTGYESMLNFTTVTSGWTSEKLDGAVYAEPLVFSGAVLVATENNSVYSLDALNGTVLWRTNLGAPVPGDQLQCGDISPSGITGTPVIDASTNTIFVVTFTNLHHYLIGLDVRTGAVLSNRSAEPPNFDVTAQQERSALTLANGIVYVPYGGLDGDCGQYHGWVIGLAANGTGKMDVYQVPTTREGAVWAPSGAAVDSSGTLYVATGNGASDSTFDHGDSVISLSPDLTETGYFAPTNWVQLNDKDLDLGSVGPAIVGPDTIFQIGKEGVGYLLDTAKLGGIGGQIFSASVCSESFGGTAYSQADLFVPCTDGLFELHVNDSAFATSWQTKSFDAGPPILTDGVVWTVDISSGTLYGFSATTGAQVYSFPLGSVVPFCTPAAGEGHLYVAGNDQILSFSLGATS